MAPIASPVLQQLQAAVLICFLLCCATLVDAADERPASITKSHANGSQSWGYVEVRNKAHMFWFYHKSPHRVSLAEKPWPTLLYAAPASSKYIRPEGVDKSLWPPGYDETRWLQYADIIFVDSPVGTGFSYYEPDASPDVKKFSLTTMGTDVVVLLKDLALQIPTLPSSPLILLGKTYAGDQVGPVAGNVVQAINERRLNLKVGGVVFGFGGRATIMPFSFDPEEEDTSSTENE